MSRNSNKTISVNSNGMIISFTDSNKHQFVKFDKNFSTRKESYKEVERPVFNDRQHKMYSEACYGLSIYSEDVINKMPKKVLVKITTRFEMVQKTINLWKQDIVNTKVDGLLSSLFPKSPIVKSIVGMEPDESIRCNFSNRELGLSQIKIAKKLVDVKLLPLNFFDLV